MSQYVEWASEVAREAGAILLRFYDRGVGFEYKSRDGGPSTPAPAGRDADLVTEADRTSERFIIERLRGRFPDHDIVAEESGRRETGSEYRWYIDPLDGTTNFAHSFPVFAVSIGLEKGSDMIAAVVFDPTRNEMFTAEAGGGAYLNNKRIAVSKVPRLLESLTATGFPSAKRKQNPNIYYYHQITLASHGVRRPGSAALDLCSVAAGRLEAFWEFRLGSWDCAAGKLLIAEAGGRVTDMEGAPHNFKSESIVGSNGLIHAELLETFAKIKRGEDLDPLPSRA
jgi:myo-inositol-1(or 4)-monophosphatase